VQDDLNFPKALAALNSGLHNKQSDADALYLLGMVDEVLGLKFKEIGMSKYEEWHLSTIKFKKLLAEREQARKERNWAEADRIRNEIAQQGYEVEDTVKGPVVKRR
jgi:cysteinyl-tRNA synthetase